MKRSNPRQLSLFGLIRQALNLREIKPAPKPVRPASKRKRVNDPELQKIWLRLQEEWFPRSREVRAYTVAWSKRAQKRTLASCNATDKHVNVARELNYPDHQKWIEPLLYHEMCHAFIGKDVMHRNGKRCWHGTQFKELENRHPMVREMDKWIKQGGWMKAVRSDRSKRAWQKRTAA